MKGFLIEIRDRASAKHIDFVKVEASDEATINHAINTLFYRDRMLQHLIPNYDRDTTIIDAFDESCPISAHITNPNG